MHTLSYRSRTDVVVRAFLDSVDGSDVWASARRRVPATAAPQQQGRPSGGDLRTHAYKQINYGDGDCPGQHDRAISSHSHVFPVRPRRNCLALRSPSYLSSSIFFLATGMGQDPLSLEEERRNGGEEMKVKGRSQAGGNNLALLYDAR